MDVQAQLNKRLTDRYAIEREIGAGGMATVYLARDLKHNRKVALKVLKPELGAVLGVERFLSEIQVTANLQHPHLLPLFDSGEADGLLFYVMPYVEGESLRDRLDRERQLPVDEAVRLISAVASALDYAHRHNVIHRDLKPENILLHDGQPIVADFGIALAVSNAGGARVTQTGLSLGTPQYMSPEQATGDRVLDSRTDIYSLGAVAYEMLVGDPPHLGSTAQAIIAKVLTERPPSIRSARPSVPERVDAAIGRALEKLPADRWATAHEFADVLSGKTGWTGPVAASASAAAPRSRVLRALPWIVAAAGVAFAVTERARREPTRSAPPPVTRSFVTLPDSTYLIGPRPVAISEDGRTIAFVATSRSGGRRLYVRASDGIEARPITESIAGMSSPALSPDGSGVVFMVRDSVLKSAPLGSAPTLLVRIARIYLRPLHWGADGHVVVAAGRALLRVPSAGGAADTLLSYPSDGPAVALALPRVLPDGKAILFTVTITSPGGESTYEIRALDLESRKVSVVVAGRGAQFVEPGFLVFLAADGTSVAQAFDPRSLTVSGPTVAISVAAFDGEISPNGVSVIGESRSASAQLFSVSGRGAPAALPLPSGDIRSVRFDLEGRRLVHGQGVPDGQVFVTDLALGTNTQILPKSWRGYDPFWSPDGRSVTFHATRAAPGPGVSRPTLEFDGFEMSADGTGVPRQLFRDSLAGAPQAWLPDGKLLSRGSMNARATGTSDLFVHTLSEDTATSVPWLHAPWDERSATASPDGRFIAFVSSESGHDEITVRPYPDPSAGKSVISENPAQDPVWSRDGKTLYYWEGPTLRAARLRTSPSVGVISRETVLTDADYYRSCCFPNYDVAPDGKTIVFARLTGDGRISGFTLVTNWGEEIRAKLAAAHQSRVTP